MATCKDCVNYSVCKIWCGEANIPMSTDCDFFKNKADFVEVKWISVKERLPEKARDYLCRCVIKDNYDYPFFMVLRYILINENPHFQHECEDGLRVTHWMPLPEPPMKEGAE